MREEQPPLYLNFSAASAPKPAECVKAVTNFLAGFQGNADRGGGGSFQVEDFRNKLKSFLKIPAKSSIVITQNATYAANLALHLLLDEVDEVFVDEYAHNAFLRPLYAREPSQLVLARRNGAKEMPVPELSSENSLYCLNLVCNVTGKVVSDETLQSLRGWQISGANRWILADASQWVGYFDFSERSFPLLAEKTIVVFSGHKALMGPAASGFCVIPEALHGKPWITGGTGTDSANPKMPENGPRRYEAGTLPLTALVGLEASIERGAATYAKEAARRKFLAQTIFEKTRSLSSFHVVSVEPKSSGSALVTFYHKKLRASEVGYLLEKEFRILSRTGYHCAPLHFGSPPHYFQKEIGEIRERLPADGVVRLSPTHALTENDMERILSALEALQTFL